MFMMKRRKFDIVSIEDIYIDKITLFEYNHTCVSVMNYAMDIIF